MKINKFALSTNEDKRLQKLERVTPYPHGADAGRVGKTLLMDYIKMKNWISRLTQRCYRRKQNRPQFILAANS